MLRSLIESADKALYLQYLALAAVMLMIFWIATLAMRMK